MFSFSHIVVFVNDLDLMERFYRDIFSTTTVWKLAGEKAYLTTGNNDVLALLRQAHEVNSEFDLQTITNDPKQTPNFPHFGVVVSSDAEFEDLLHKIKSRGIQIAGPKVSRDTTKSFYFLDPERNCVQVVFPPKSYYSKNRGSPNY